MIDLVGWLVLKAKRATSRRGQLIIVFVREHTCPVARCAADRHTPGYRIFHPTSSSLVWRPEQIATQNISDAVEIKFTGWHVHLWYRNMMPVTLCRGRNEYSLDLFREDTLSRSITLEAVDNAPGRLVQEEEAGHLIAQTQSTNTKLFLNDGVGKFACWWPLFMPTSWMLLRWMDCSISYWGIALNRIQVSPKIYSNKIIQETKYSAIGSADGPVV
ncbi:hypothetical protein J6590_071258 [Homalodisca vitripennis]|nr:hypothetical protein J6590_071258 [Homalodisca vitripennis]